MATKNPLEEIKKHQEAIAALKEEAIQALENEKNTLNLQLRSVERQIAELRGKPVTERSSGSGSGSGGSRRERMSAADAEAAKQKVIGTLSKSWKTKADIATATGVKLDFVSRVLDTAVKEGAAQARSKADHKGKGIAPKEYAKK